MNRGPVSLIKLPLNLSSFTTNNYKADHENSTNVFDDQLGSRFIYSLIWQFKLTGMLFGLNRRASVFLIFFYL